MTIKIVAFDIDGTLLNSNREVSTTNLNTLYQLGENGVVRIAATGRNLHSLHRIFPEDFPIDYAVFSSGAGILNWKTKQILKSIHLHKEQIKERLSYLNYLKRDFLVKEAIPNSHFMQYKWFADENNDLKNYQAHYAEYTKPLKQGTDSVLLATQFIVQINDEVKLHDTFKSQFENCKSILTTSPIDHKTMWVEIFNKEVSKANGIQYLCDILDIQHEDVFCIGNDYNDLDMLNFFKNSYVVSNAPEELTKMFACVASNDNDGFTEGVNLCLNSFS